ncbi:fructosamine/ketosamine-3-kinase [Apiospora aurea]|uniref:protein-ribulosamine 3-kinase n=1 Tax=Apiospora aurea TaxID=335848 RepID=A0ABR1QMY2_9PEZI
MIDENNLDPAITAGYKIELEGESEDEEFFVKILDCERADEMAMAEFECQRTLMQYIPEHVVSPIAWGRFQEDPTKAFYLTHFRYLHEKLPTTQQLLPIVKKLHLSSTSPTGKFGFPVTTFWGPPPMDNSWTDSWEEYFTRKFRAALEYGQQPHGRDDELCELGDQFIQKVIPRLLRPLQTDGRSIKPTLCHGDLWDANVQVDASTRLPIIFDPCCFYGHHESEFALPQMIACLTRTHILQVDFQSMRSAPNTLGQEIVNTYKNEVGASEPQEDFDDRNALYSMRGDLETVGMWPQWHRLLQHSLEIYPVVLRSLSVKDEMRRLLEKYPDGFAGFKRGVARGDQPISNM